VMLGKTIATSVQMIMKVPVMSQFSLLVNSSLLKHQMKV